jgi:hypothetical protein
VLKAPGKRWRGGRDGETSFRRRVILPAPARRHQRVRLSASKHVSGLGLWFRSSRADVFETSFRSGPLRFRPSSAGGAFESCFSGGIAFDGGDMGCVWDVLETCSGRHRRRRRVRPTNCVRRLLGSNGRMRCDCIQATRRRPRVRSCASSLLERYRLNRDRSGSEWRGGGAAALATTAREERERWRSGAEPRTQYEGQTSSGIRRSPEAGPTEKRFCVSTAISGRVRCRRLFIGLSDMYGRAATRPWLARCFSLTLEDGRSPTSPPEIDSTRGVLTSGHNDI